MSNALDLSKIFAPITANGCAADRRMLMDAFSAWIPVGTSAGYASLAAALNRISPMTHMSYPYNRVADRLVQKLRKADLIRRVGSKWELTESGIKVAAQVQKGFI